MSQKKVIIISIGFVVVVLGGIGVWQWPAIQSFFVQNVFVGQSVPQQPDTSQPQEQTDKEKLLAGLNEAGDKEDYEKLGDLLKTAYAQGYMSEKDFQSAESKAYVKATAIYTKGDLQKALDISTSVYNKAPEGWRFRYLRIVILEKLGREALAKKDLDTAEKYAQTILQMLFRPEGADLMGDIYIERINNALNVKDIKKAQTLYAYIKDYEVSPAIRTKLDDLAKRLQ